MITSQPLTTGHSCVRFIKEYDYPFDMVELQMDLYNFRYHSDLDVASERNVTQPLNQVAKKLCKCGCGQEIITKKWHRNNEPNYIIGHHSKNKSYEEMYGISKANELKELRKKHLKARIRTIESKNKLSETRKQLFKEGKLKTHNKKEFDIEQIKTLHFEKRFSIDYIAKEIHCHRKRLVQFCNENNILFERNLQPPEHSKNLSLAKRGKSNPKISEKAKERAKRINFHLRKYYYKKDSIPITKGKTLEEVYGKEKAKSILDKMSKLMINLHSKEDSPWKNQNFIKKITSLSKERWKDLKFRENTIKATLKALQKRPLKSEKELDKFLQHDFPKEWKYTGDGSFLIGYKNPDFININGKKICIEVYHPYFKIRDFGSCENYEKQRSEHFTKYGWKTIFVKIEELNESNKLKQKIIQFTNQ